MSQTITLHDIDQMVASLAAYLPGGELFEAKQISGSKTYDLLTGLCGQLLEAENFLALYNSEFIPDTTTVFIEEWESVVGIPDECFVDLESQTTDERRKNILVKLASLGVQTVADFQSLAEILGFSATVSPGVSNDDLIVNGTFDTDSDWVKNAGWTISGGAANRTNVGAVSDINQNPTFLVGQNYLVRYDVLNYVSGSITPYLGGTSGTPVSADGSYEELLIAGNTNTEFRMIGDTTFEGSVDNISLRRVYTATLADARNTIVVIFDSIGNNFPIPFPIQFGDDSATILNCLFNKLKPATSQVLFVSG